jgi:hypothetical protein
MSYGAKGLRVQKSGVALSLDPVVGFPSRMSVLLKLVIVVAIVGLFRCSERFRTKSREFDEAALDSLQRIMRASEDSGYPSELIPLLIGLSAVMFMAMMAGLGSMTP